MIEIPLTQGMVAIVDDEDAYLAAYNWCASPEASTRYAVRGVRRGGRQVTIRLHRVITNAPPGFDVDHINGNGLDCRRSNLRVVTRAQNTRNARRRRDNTSGFKGVSWSAKAGRWSARVGSGIRGKRIWLGYFSTKEAAARAYDDAARAQYGQYASPNFDNPTRENV
jgi:hypothetical protein